MFYAKEGLIDEQMEKILYCVSCQLYAIIGMALHNGINRLRCFWFCCCLISGKFSDQLWNKTEHASLCTTHFRDIVLNS